MTRNEPSEERWSQLRLDMVDRQLRSRGIRDKRVLDAMSTIPRHRFIPPERRCDAYEDRALPVRCGQTISQPYIVAYMTEQLEVSESDSVLEIGTGTGYQTAVLARLCRHVHSVERIAELQAQAQTTLGELNITNITFSLGDGSVGLPKIGPFDRIVVTAGAPGIPKPLTEQLADGGRMVLPVGGPHEQTIVRVVRQGSRTVETPSLACRFVKLIGTEGWSATR